MASTYSTNLKIELIGTGEQAGTWGTTTNTNLGTALEQAVVGKADVTMSSTTITLTLTNANTAQNARAIYLNLTGSPGGAAVLEVPAIQKPYIVKNGSDQQVTIKVSGQTGVAIPTGKTALVYNNGTDVVTAVDFIPEIATTTVDTTNIEVTNIKAKDGTASITLADSTGVASFTANPVMSGGTANGVAFLNGSNVLTAGSALSFNGTVLQNTQSSAADGIMMGLQNTTTGSFIQFSQPGVANLLFGCPNADAFVWKTFGSGTYPERMRITSDGDLLIGKTAISITANGAYFQPGRNAGNGCQLGITNTENSNTGAVLTLNRQGSDGDLIYFYQANIEEGGVSVSGSTVSYNGGHLSRWAQMLTKPDLLKGTVMSNLDEMNVYVKPTLYWTEEDELPVDEEGNPTAAVVMLSKKPLSAKTSN
jgi:hypothetical protein